MFADIGKMLKLVGEIKTKLPEMRENLAAAEFSAEAGGGAVRATVNGQMALVNIEIDKKLLGVGGTESSGEMLADLIKASVSAAQAQAAKAAAEAMKELTGGMDIPGLEGLIG